MGNGEWEGGKRGGKERGRGIGGLKGTVGRKEGERLCSKKHVFVSFSK